MLYKFLFTIGVIATSLQLVQGEFDYSCAGKYTDDSGITHFRFCEEYSIETGSKCKLVSDDGNFPDCCPKLLCPGDFDYN